MSDIIGDMMRLLPKEIADRFDPSLVSEMRDYCNSAVVDQVVEEVREDLLRRSQFGIKKYGVTLERTDLNLRDWLQHAYEETLDQANYLKRAIMEIDNQGDTDGKQD